MSIETKVTNWLLREGDLNFTYQDYWFLFFYTMVYANPQMSQQFFRALLERLPKDTHHEKNEIRFYNILSYMAYCNPKQDQEISLLSRVYQIDRIQLTSGWLSSPYYAYGFKSKDGVGPSYLIFKGTTFPSDNGFLVSLLADSKPGGAIGCQLYARGALSIQAWLKSQPGQVICVGQSLGGAMSLHTHIHQPHQVDFFAVNPPSLTRREQKIYESHGMADDSFRTLKVITHHADPVFNLGSQYLPKNTLICRHGKLHENMFFAHARCVGDDELKFEPYQDDLIKPHYFWKILKPFLYVFVLFLTLITLPFRVMIHLCSEKEAIHNPLAMR
jgi:hypothetical protein